MIIPLMFWLLYPLLKVSTEYSFFFELFIGNEYTESKNFTP